MSLQIANAPCSWGVDFADAPANPPWDRVLQELAAAGFRATELGPFGYLPTDSATLAEILRRFELQVIAGTLFRPFQIRAERKATLQMARDCCSLLSKIGGQYLVVIDAFSDDRVATAGQSQRARRLERTEWTTLLGTIHDASRIASEEYGITPVLHSHAGTYIEFEDELNSALEDLPADLVKLCIDTGHFAYSGMSTNDWIRTHRERLAFLHLKDISARQLARVRSEALDFWTAVAAGIFCPLGQGIVDFAAIRLSLAEINYRGWAVVEQDCDPRVEPDPLRDAKASLEFLRMTGFANDATARPKVKQTTGVP
jgi:inosose dehydratase